MSFPHRNPPAVLTLTGASGAGKTTLVRALEARALPGVRCYYFDSIGVPSPEEMVREFGSGEGWQGAMTSRWMHRLAQNEDGASVAVLDGQVRPTFILSAYTEAGIGTGHIVLCDCAADVRRARLAGPRGQPDLATAQMDMWAAYLRGQADALALPILDTTDLGVEPATDVLEAHVRKLLPS